MPVKERRLIFELTAQEKENRFKSVLDKATQRAAELNLPKIYKNELCIKPNLFIHKYADGTELLIEQDSNLFVERTIRVLH